MTLKPSILLLAMLGCLSLQNANATVWNWSFGDSSQYGLVSGTFTTSGTGSDAGIYNLIDFSVDKQEGNWALEGGLGDTYQMLWWQISEPYSMEFDGNKVTKWLSSGSVASSNNIWVFSPYNSSRASIVFGWENRNPIVENAGFAGFLRHGTFVNNTALTVTPVTVPVPEPETYALMGIGLLGLIAARGKKKSITLIN